MSRSISEWLGLEPGARRLTPGPRICTPDGILFGGATLAALVAAAEQATGRRTLWAHAQFVRAAPVSKALDLLVEPRVQGRRITHAAASASQDGQPTALAQLALVEGWGEEPPRSWDAAPSVPDPERCPEREYRQHAPESINGALDVRLARGHASDGRCLLWARVRQPLEISAATLALLADQVPFGVFQALGKPVPVASLDNAIRVVATVPTEWVLLEIAIAAISGSLGHGGVRLWARDGTLLGMGEQSFRVSS